MCDAGQGLIEGGRVAVVRQRDTDAAGQQPAGEGERVFVLQQPILKLLIIDSLPLCRHMGTRETSAFCAAPNCSLEGGLKRLPGESSA